MTKSKGIGRGGHRVGAGRKAQIGAAYVKREPKVLAVKVKAKPEPKPKAKAPEIEAQGDQQPNLIVRVETAKELRSLALGVLKQILETSTSDQARVAASKEILVRSESEVEGVGKKGIAKATAQGVAQGGGKFAPPMPPNKIAIQ